MNLFRDSSTEGILIFPLNSFILTNLFHHLSTHFQTRYSVLRESDTNLINSIITVAYYWMGEQNQQATISIIGMLEQIDCSPLEKKVNDLHKDILYHVLLYKSMFYERQRFA